MGPRSILTAASTPASQDPSISAKLHVVHVLHSFGTGGLEKGIATVVRHASAGFEHTVVCLTISGESERLLPAVTRVIELRKKPGNSPAFLWRLSRELRRLAPDVVHTRNWSGLDGVIAARLAGIRTVAHGEHGWGMEDPDGLSPRRLRIRRLLSRWVCEYTCVSKAMERWLRQEVGVRRPLTQVYNGVDPTVFHPRDRGAQRAALGVSTLDFLVGIAGRLDPIKAHPVLFEAVRALRASHPTARLLVVGDGPERVRLEALAGEEVCFLGNRDDVPELMAALDVFVLCSRNEGISNTILEAMATGLPVVATAVGGNHELVVEGVTGRLVPEGDSGALAAALESYAVSSEMRALHGNAGLERVLRLFTVEGMVRAYEGVWRRVAGRGSEMG